VSETQKAAATQQRPLESAKFYVVLKIYEQRKSASKVLGLKQVRVKEIAVRVQKLS
jgi:hypothetical protein